MVERTHRERIRRPAPGPHRRRRAGHLPPGVTPAYLDGFLARHRPTLVSVIERNLARRQRRQPSLGGGASGRLDGDLRDRRSNWQVRRGVAHQPGSEAIVMPPRHLACGGHNGRTETQERS